MVETECLYDKYIKNFRCKYYITKSTKQFIDNEDNVKVFGVKIDKLNNNGKIVSTACVEDVGINEYDVRQFIKQLTEGKVTPIALEDIVVDKL